MAITCGFDHEGQPLFIPLFKDPFPYVLVRSGGEPNNFLSQNTILIAVLLFGNI